MFVWEEFEAIYNRIRYRISLKSGIIFSHVFVKIKVDFYDSFPIEERLTLHNVIIHMKSSRNEDKNCYYIKIFFEKYLYQLAKK